MQLSVDGVPVVARELVDVTGNRMHVLDAIGSKVVMDYEAVVDGEAAPPPVDDFDLITYLRPSRYCESDSLAPTAAAEFGGTARRRAPRRRLHLGVEHPHVRPRARACRPTAPSGRSSGARASAATTRTCASRCSARMNVPARLAAVFAPGLSPMEYHAVCEAYLEPSDATPAAGTSSTPPGSPRGRACCGSRPAATPRTPRSSRTTAAPSPSTASRSPPSSTTSAPTTAASCIQLR